MSSTHKLTFWILTLFSRWLRSLSHSGRKHVGDILARFAYHLIAKRKDEALVNIAHAFPEMSITQQDQILRNCYRYFSRNSVQFLAFPNSFRRCNVEVRGQVILDNALAGKKGLVFVTGHCGAWEILAAWLGYNNYHFVGVAARQKNLGANKFFQDLRETSGIKHIFRKSPIESMYQVLEDNGILCLAADQDAGRKGIFVDFFGKPASTPKGPALFHLKTEAPMVFGSVFRTGNSRYIFEIQEITSPEKTPESITQSYTSILEKKIRKYPEQYFWFHRRWKTQKPTA